MSRISPTLGRLDRALNGVAVAAFLTLGVVWSGGATPGPETLAVGHTAASLVFFLSALAYWLWALGFDRLRRTRATESEEG